MVDGWTTGWQSGPSDDMRYVATKSPARDGLPPFVETAHVLMQVQAKMREAIGRTQFGTREKLGCGLRGDSRSSVFFEF